MFFKEFSSFLFLSDQFNIPNKSTSIADENYPPLSLMLQSDCIVIIL